MWIESLAAANPPSAELADSLRFQHNASEIALRSYLSHVLNRLPYGLYRPIVDITKRIRSIRHLQAALHYEAGAYAQQFANLQPKTLRVCLTHDIDTAACAAHWPKVIALEETYALRSSSNVLTNGPYQLDKLWLDEMEQSGFEIGLHGDSHDAGIGFRPATEIKARLQTCLDLLGRKVTGYRAPALGASETLLSVLQELGFRYDSSILVKLYYRNGVNACHPYLYPNTKIWQLPLAIQDDGLFRDRSLNDEQAFETLRQMLLVVQEQNGLLVFNSHPIHLQARMAFYERFLAYLKESAISVVLAGDLVQELDEAIA